MVYSGLCECNEHIYTVNRAVTFLFHGVINKLKSRLWRLLGYKACGWCGYC